MRIGMTKQSSWSMVLIALLAMTHASFAADSEFSAQSRGRQRIDKILTGETRTMTPPDRRIIVTRARGGMA